MQSQHRFAHDFNRLRWVRLGAILSLAVLSALPAAAEGENAIVRSAPAQLEVSAGQIASLDVVLADAQSVYGIDVSATFDPQLVEVVDADPAKDGVQATPGAFPKPDFVARNVADNQAGTLHYAVTQVNPTEPVNGTGIIFTVQFRAKAPSGQGAFTIASVDLTDRDGIALGVQPESGVIRIVAAGQASPTTAAPTATPIVPTATPTNAPSPLATATSMPEILTLTPTSLPAQVAPGETPAPPPAVSPSPAPAVAAPIAPSADTPPGAAQQPAAIPVDAAGQSAAPSEQAAPQALAAAVAPATVAPADASTVAVAAGPAEDGATTLTTANAKIPGPDQTAPSLLPRRQASADEASIERSTPADPSRALLIVGITALAMSAVTALLILLILRR